MTIAEKVSHSANRALFTLYKEGLFYKCYNADVMVFVIKVKNYKVSSKFVKSAGEKVYSIGFPSSEVLNGNLSFKSISEKIGAKSFEEWNAMQDFISGKPSWCYYNFDEKNREKYGKLYNWFAVNDSRGLAPNGYHISSQQEWINLINYLGGEGNASFKLINTSGWAWSYGDNTSEFSALPGGYFNPHEEFNWGLDYIFQGEGEHGYWWTSSRGVYDSFPVAYNVNILRDREGPIKRVVIFWRNYGLSVRCIKD
jgi:uncharacterized protein (TIGR02145 family)